MMTRRCRSSCDRPRKEVVVQHPRLVVCVLYSVNVRGIAIIAVPRLHICVLVEVRVSGPVIVLGASPFAGIGRSGWCF